LPCPIFHDRDRQWALFAVFLGDVNPFQGLWAVTAPLPNPCYRFGFLLGAVPELTVYAGRLLAGVLNHPFDG
jgi:hypothetical protein